MNAVAKQFDDRPHWSFSQIDTFLTCSQRFFYRYIARVPEERISPSLIFGSAIHEALKEMFLQRQKLEAEGRSRADIDWDAVRAVFAGTLERSFEGPVPVEGKEDDTLENLRAKGLAMIEKIFPDLVPEKILEVSRAFLVPLVTADGQVLEKPLMGEFDLVVEGPDGRPIVIDFKTASKRWSDGEVEQNLQASAYVLAVRELLGTDAGFRFEVLLKTKAPALERYETERKERDLARFVSIARGIERAVAAEIFFPRPNSYCPSCPFRDRCLGR